MTDENMDHVAQSFVAARAQFRSLARYPGELPATLDEAYHIQAKARALAEAPILGWKLGRIGAPLDAELGIDRLCGPIYRVETGADPVIPVIANGFAAAEAEFLFRIAALPQSRDVDPLACIDVVHVGLEIAGSPFPGINEHGPYVTISDYGNNMGLVVGPSIPDWRDAGFADWLVRFVRDGDEIATGRACDILDGPFAAVRFLFAEAARLGLPLAIGQWISAGAVTGVHPVQHGTRVRAHFAHGLTVEAHFAHPE